MGRQVSEKFALDIRPTPDTGILEASRGATDAYRDELPDLGPRLARFHAGTLVPAAAGRAGTLLSPFRGCAQQAKQAAPNADCSLATILWYSCFHFFSHLSLLID